MASDAEINTIQLAVVKLEKDMEIMTLAVTKLAASTETLVTNTVEMQHLKADLSKLELAVNGIYTLIRDIQKAQSSTSTMQDVFKAILYLCIGGLVTFMVGKV